MKTQTTPQHGWRIRVATRAVALCRVTLIGILLTGTQLSVAYAGSESESDPSQAERNPVIGETPAPMIQPDESRLPEAKPTCAELDTRKVKTAVREDATPRYQLGCGTGNLIADAVSAGQ